MPIKDIVEFEARGLPVSVDVQPQSTVQSKDRSRGRFVEGRYVPSKQVKVAHRRSRSSLSLKVWARANQNDPTTIERWFGNKG
jgi:hypothetical protein